MCGMCVVHACAACVGTVCVLYMRPQECFYISLCSSLCRSFRSRHVIVRAAVSQLWKVGGMRDVILAIIAIDHAGPRSSLGCASICRTSAVQQTGLPTSRTGEGNKCYVYLMSCSPTCILSGTTGTGPAQENGSANVIRARELQSTNISDVMPCGVYIPCVPCGTHRTLMKLTTTDTPKVHPEA